MTTTTTDLGTAPGAGLCAACGKPGRLEARGLHGQCYRRAYQDGTIDQYPRVIPVGAKAMRVEGVTYRQLDHWVAKGYLHPDPRDHAVSGVTRTWPDGEVRVASVMGRLVAAGLSPELAHRVARMTEGGGEIAPGVFVLYDHRGPS